MAIIHVIHSIHIQLCMIIILWIVTFEVVVLWASTGESYSHPAVQLNIHYVAETCAVVPVYYGHLDFIYKCPDYQGVLIIQVNLYV